MPPTKKSPTRAKAVHDEVTNVKRIRRTKPVKPSEVVIDLETGATEISVKAKDNRSESQSTFHSDFVEKRRKNREKKYVDDLVARGVTVYTPDDLFSEFGVKAEEGWTQVDVQQATELGHVSVPLQKLRKKVARFEQQYSALGRKAMKGFMKEAYRIYLAAEQSSDSRRIYANLRENLKSQGTGVHKDSPGASVIMRGVFSYINSKQVHLYGRAIEAAKNGGIEVDKFEQFIEDEGGFEKLRAKQANQLKLESGDQKKSAAEAAQKRRELVLKKLAFARTEPFLKVPITRDNFMRIMPGGKIKERGKARSLVKHEMVMILAVLDEHDQSNLDMYWTVPMSTTVTDAVLNAIGETYVFNADWLERFLKWEKAQKSSASKS